MPTRYVRKWYHSFGPLNWYKGEWVRFEFEVLGRAFALVWLRTANQFSWIFGAKVVRRSMFGRPSAYEGGLHITL